MFNVGAGEGVQIRPSDVTPFEQLDFIYSPSRDVASEAAYLVEVLGARLVFAIEVFDHKEKQKPR